MMIVSSSLVGSLLFGSVLASATSAVQGRADATYDYVIIGGGTAGLTLAAWLSKYNVTIVAVVETGNYY